MNELFKEFPAILDEAERWVLLQETHACNYGRKLQSSEFDIAQLMGVQAPVNVYVCMVPEIPIPESGLLHHANQQMQFINDFTIGLTVGQGILISAGYEKNRRLLAHELVHVGQYERLGGIRHFLQTYLTQCLEYGYHNSPLEKEARTRSEELYPRRN